MLVARVFFHSTEDQHCPFIYLKKNANDQEILTWLTSFKIIRSSLFFRSFFFCLLAFSSRQVSLVLKDIHSYLNKTKLKVERDQLCLSPVAEHFIGCFNVHMKCQLSEIICRRLAPWWFNLIRMGIKNFYSRRICTSLAYWPFP